MNLQNLATHAQAGRIDALELISLEGGIYLLDIYLQVQRHSLIDARGEVVTRDELSMRIHGEPWDPDSRKVDALVSRLRKKLECDDCDIHRSLSTVHNRGYRFDDSVQIELEGTS